MEDRNRLLDMNERIFLETCKSGTVNCLDIDFRNRLEKYYPDTLIYKKESQTWDKYYFDTIKVIAILKEEYGLNYTSGNPYRQAKIISIHSKLEYPPTSSRYVPVKAQIYTDYNGILKFASEEGYMDLVKWALKKGANVHGSVHWEIREGPLRVAVDKGHLDITKILVDSGADYALIDNFNQAARKGYFPTIKYIMDLQEAVGVLDPKNLSEPLIYAASLNNLEMIKYLLEKGADPRYKNNEVLKVATSKRYWSVTNLLRQYGAQYPIGYTIKI